MVEREGTEAKLGFKGVPAHAAACLWQELLAGLIAREDRYPQLIASEPKIHPEGGGRRAS